MSLGLLQGHELLGTEGLVVDLGRGLDQILEMGPGQEVPQRDELAVVLVLDVDDTPAILTAYDVLSTNNNLLLGADNGKGSAP